MYSFRNDYTETAHPNILDAIVKTNMDQDVGYGLDKICMRAADIIKKHVGNENANVHFIVGGTQTNLIAISSFLRPHEAVIAADTAHISTHETGAIEATGHKIIIVPNKDGKISVAQIKEKLDEHTDEHMVKPRLVKISNSTELGTVYSKSEIADISKFCKENNLLLYLDGARIGVALDASNGDLTLKDLYDLTDAFYIGGTKNGALLGEALVIRNDSLNEDFRFMIKQKGAMLAKGRVLGIQFEQLLKDGLFFELAKNANEKAEVLRQAIKEAGYSFLVETETNQVFPIFPQKVIDKLSENFAFQFWSKYDDENTVVRFVTSWATTDEAVNSFSEEMKTLKA